MTPANATIWGTVGNNSARIRTSDLNNNVSSSSLAFAFFTTKLVQVSSNFTNSLLSVSAPINTVILDVCFGSTANEFYVLILESKLLSVAEGKAYAILFYNGTQLKNKVFLYEIDPSSNILDEFLCSNGRIVLLFTTMLKVYSVSNFTLVSVLIKFTYSSTSKTNLDVEMVDEILIFSFNQKLSFYNTTGHYYSLEYYFTNDTIRSVTRIPDSCYVVVKMNYTITQFDYCIGQPVHVFNFNGDNKQKVSSFGLNSFGVYVDLVGTYPKLYSLFNVTSEYPCSACTCLNTYGFNSTAQTCVKNLIIPINQTVNLPINITANTTSPVNETVNLTTPVAQPNVTLNLSTPILNKTAPVLNQSVPIPVPVPVPEPTQATPASPDKNYSNLIDSIIPVSTTQIIGTTSLIVTSLRVTSSSLSIFMLFFNDLWYYKFHRKQNPEYPNSTKVFMNKVDLIKSFHLNPDMLIDYLPFTASFSNTSGVYQRNQRLSQQLQLKQDAPDKVYFLYSTEEVYKNSAIMAVFFFVAMKVVHLLLYFIRKKVVLLMKLYKFVRTRSRWWSLLTAIIETNGVMLGFCSGLQMEVFYAQDMADKLNLFYMTFMLFCLIFYTTAFYLLIGFLQRKRKDSAILLVYTKSTRKSLFFEPIIILARSFIKSFFHSYFLGVYSTQIVLLFIVDFVFVLFSLSIRKFYLNANVFFFFTAYLVGFMVFDLYFLLEEYKIITIADADRELYGFILCCLLAFVSVMLSMVLLFNTVREMYKFLKSIMTKQNDSEQDLQNPTTINQAKTEKVEYNSCKKQCKKRQLLKIKNYNQRAQQKPDRKQQKNGKGRKDKILYKNHVIYEYDEEKQAYKFTVKFIKHGNKQSSLTKKNPQKTCTKLPTQRKIKRNKNIQSMRSNNLKIQGAKI